MTLSAPVRLAAMMFLQYGALGAWIVPLARWLDQAPADGGLGFSHQQIGWIYSTLAIGSIVAPLITGVLADRTFASEKLIAYINGILTGLALLAGYWCWTHSGERADADAAFGPLCLILLTYSILIIVGITSGSAMTLRALSDPTKQFGRVRLVGTFGWVVMIAVAAGPFKPLSAEPFVVAAVCHGLLATGMRWLPHTPPLGYGRPLAEVIGLPAIKLFRDRSFVVFAVVALLAHQMQAWYGSFGNVCCAKLGMAHSEIVMTSSNFVEMACMALIPFMVPHFGLKTTMLIGLIAWITRCAVFSTESLLWITWLAVPLQGMAYTWFTIVGSLYIDREAPPHLRAGAQSLLTFIASGLGTMTGNVIAGNVIASHTMNGRTDWTAVWLVPTVGCSIAFVIFLFFFREPQAQ